MIQLDQILFGLAFLISLAASAFGLRAYLKIKGSLLGKVTLSTVASIFVFGTHSLMESIEAGEILHEIGEVLEIGGTFFLLLAAYYIYVLSKELFVPETSSLKKIKKPKKSKK
ncbi:MAG: hypothetical protein AABX05_05075 [Nanoarchaeota archaeon]